MKNEPLDLAFLHGGGQGSWVWGATIAAVRIQADDAVGKIVALDVPGCGAKRGRVTEALSPQDVALELISDLETAGMKNVVLVGHSLAGNLMPRLSDLRPDLFHRLIYVSCSIPLPGQTVVQLMGSGLHGSNENEVGWPVDPSTTTMRDRYEAMYCNDMNETQKSAFLADLEQDEWPMNFFSTTNFYFEDISSVPATYIVCLMDRILPVAWQETFSARFRAKRLVRIDAGHQVMITRPQSLAEAIHQEAKADR